MLIFKKGGIYIKTKSLSFRYSLLGRLVSDCNYYLGCGNRNEEDLWAKNVEEQIETMKGIFDSFAEDEKPDWIDMSKILEYESKMKGGYLCTNYI